MVRGPDCEPCRVGGSVLGVAVDCNDRMSGVGSSTPIPASNASIQSASWSGCIPVVLSLAPTSLSSPSPPRPIHKLVSRMTYLPLALHDEVMQLSAHAFLATGSAASVSVEEPPDSPGKGGEAECAENKEQDSAADATDSAEDESPGESGAADPKQPDNKRDAYPECWFEDEESGVPLRWHLFVGVLYDIMKGRTAVLRSSADRQPTLHNFLPWRIRIHFTSYPADQLLPLDDGSGSQPKLENANNNNGNHSFAHITTIVGRMFRNSLKQALFMQYGSSKVAMAITKSSHEKVWDAVLQSNYSLYTEVNKDLQAGISLPSQSAADGAIRGKHGQGGIPRLIPVRLMRNGLPAVQRPIKHEEESRKCRRTTEMIERLETCRAPPHTTLGDVLSKFLPDHFAIDPSSGWASATSDPSLYYCIQGVQPSLKCAIVDLWRALSHPDHFLHITVNE